MFDILSKSEGTTLIVGLPWPRSGTGRVVETQISDQQSIGRRAVLIAVPRDPSQRRSTDIWRRFSSYSGEFGADETLIATFDRRIRKGGRLGRWLSARRKFNAMHWAMQAAAVSPIPVQLDQELRSGQVCSIIVNSVFALKFGIKLKKRLIELGLYAPIILVTHDVQSHILLDNDSKNPFTRKLDSLDELLATEIAALGSADVLVHVSLEDKLFFEDAIPNRPHVLALPASRDLSGVEHPLQCSARNDYLFVGSNNIANLRALDWFFSGVVPWTRQSELSLQIVGNIDELVRDQHDLLFERIRGHFVGSVPETLPYYLVSRCVLIPMVSGRGVSMKTVEAAAVGKPIVGTKFAFRGLPLDVVREAGFKLCDDPKEFALEMNETLNSPSEKAQASSRLFERLFSLDRFSRSMAEAEDLATRQDSKSHDQSQH